MTRRVIPFWARAAIAVCAALGTSAAGLSFSSAAGASTTDPTAVTAPAPPDNAVGASNAPNGITPDYDVWHCTTYVDKLSNGTAHVRVCINLFNATTITTNVTNNSGPTFSAHQHVSGYDVTKTSQTATYVGDGASVPYSFRAYGNHTYCVTLWHHVSGTTYQDMGSACT